MSSPFGNEPGLEQMPALNALDAGKGVGQENEGQNPAHFAYENDSDHDHEEPEGDDAALLNSAYSGDRTVWAEAQEGHLDESWLGAQDDEGTKEEHTPTTDETTSPKRPYDLMLGNDPEDQHTPLVSPRTRKRLRTERERGFPFEYRPRAAFGGRQVDSYDRVGEIFPMLLREDNRWKRAAYIKGKAVGKGVPEFPNLPNHPSPLGQEAHANGKWKGLLTVPTPPQKPQAERAASPAESEWDREPEEDDGDYDDDDSQPPRPSTPTPEYEYDEEDWDESLERGDATRRDDQDETSPEAAAESEYHNYNESTASMAHTPAVSFEEALAMGKKTNWSDDDDDDEFLKAFVEAAPAVTGASPPATGAFDEEEEEEASDDEEESSSDEEQASGGEDESSGDEDGASGGDKGASGGDQESTAGEDGASERASPEDDGPQQQEERQNQHEYLNRDSPLNDDDNDTSSSSSGSSYSDGPSPSFQESPPSSVRHPFSRENGWEAGQISQPRPRDEELAQLRLENSRLALNVIREQKKCEEKRSEDTKEFNRLLASYHNLRDDHSRLRDDYCSFRDFFSQREAEFKSSYHELEDECSEIKQRAEYDAKILAEAREKDDNECLVLINTLRLRARKMESWAERLDAAAEPLRKTNDALTAKLEAAEETNKALAKKLEEAGARGLAMARLYREATKAKKSITQQSTVPVTETTRTVTAAQAASSLFSIKLPTPARFATQQETSEAREARWRNLGAHNTTQDTLRTAQKPADDKYYHDRELRLQTIADITRRFAMNLEAAQREVNLAMRIDGRQLVV